MKKILSVSLLSTCVLFLYACSRKTTPTKSTVETKAPTTDINNPIVLNSNYSFGKEIYESKCGSCHSLNKPSDYTYNQWYTIMDRMAKKAALDYMQKQNVLSYLKDNAKAVK